MLDPVSNQIAAQRIAQAAAAKRVQDSRRAGPEKSGRREEPDSFDAALDRAEAVENVRPLADADQEEAREDREQFKHGNYGPGHPSGPSNGSIDLNA